jgi:VanZ family protein
MLKLIIYLRPFARYLLIAWALTIIIVSSIPNIPTLKIHTAKSVIRLDYMMHFCEYGVLSFMTFLSFAGNKFTISYKKFIMITVFLILFAVLDELHQKLIPGRTYSIRDIASNLTGILAVGIFALVLFRFVRISLNQVS